MLMKQARNATTRRKQAYDCLRYPTSFVVHLTTSELHEINAESQDRHSGCLQMLRLQRIRIDLGNSTNLLYILAHSSMTGDQGNSTTWTHTCLLRLLDYINEIFA